MNLEIKIINKFLYKYIYHVPHFHLNDFFQKFNQSLEISKLYYISNYRKIFQKSYGNYLLCNLVCNFEN